MFPETQILKIFFRFVEFFLTRSSSAAGTSHFKITPCKKQLLYYSCFCFYAI